MLPRPPSLPPQGISGKSQLLFLTVFVFRYLDLFTNFVSLYNTVMKLLFISATAATVYLIYVKFKATYDGNHDTFRIEFVLVPAAVLALIFHYSSSILEVRCLLNCLLTNSIPLLA